MLSKISIPSTMTSVDPAYRFALQTAMGLKFNVKASTNDNDIYRLHKSSVLSVEAAQIRQRSSSSKCTYQACQRNNYEPGRRLFKQGHHRSVWDCRVCNLLTIKLFVYHLRDHKALLKNLLMLAEANENNEAPDASSANGTKSYSWLNVYQIQLNRSSRTKQSLTWRSILLRF